MIRCARRASCCCSTWRRAWGNYNERPDATIPVSGRFTRRQKQVYNAVLRVFRQMSKAMVPGKTSKDLRTECEQFVAEECVGLGLKASALEETDAGQSGGETVLHAACRIPSRLDKKHDVTYNHLSLSLKDRAGLGDDYRAGDPLHPGGGASAWLRTRSSLRRACGF